MKFINFKKSLTFCISFFVAFFGEIAVNLACGPEQDPYDYYVSYFHNNVQGDEYVPFAYNQMVYLNSEEEIASEPEINSKEWADFLNVKEQDVFKVMYHTDSASNIMFSNYDGEISKLPDSLQKNTFLVGLSKNKDALKYYQFAKSCEPYANVDFDLWDPKPRDTVSMIEKGAEALTNLAVESNSFLKLRYAYQATRMFHYAGNYEQCKSAYLKYIQPNKAKTAVKGWGLALYAGAVRKSGNPEEAAYLFSKVFTSNPERRIQAYKNYYYINPAVDSVLKYAKNNEERVNVWALNGFGNPEFDIKSLENVYQYESKSLIIGTLLVREVNKLEESLIEANDIAKIGYNYYFNDDYRNPNKSDSIKNLNLQHLNQIRTFAVKLASEKQYPQPELGTLTAAYLSWMENKDLLAANYLATLNPEKLPKRLNNQYRIIDLLIKSKNIKKGNPFNENDLLPTLKWLDERRFAENSERSDNFIDGDKSFSLTTRNFYQQILAPAYMNLGDTAKAALAMVKGDLQTKTLSEPSLFRNMSYQTNQFWQKYLSPKSMQKLAYYKTKATGDNVTALLSKALNQLGNDDFYELYGTTFLRTHQYEKAVQMFNKVSPNYNYFTPENWYADETDSNLNADPFIQTINDYPKKYSSKASITKKAFASKMSRLQKLSVTDKKNVALYYYKMANAVYQTGHYGNSWFLISYDWSSNDFDTKPKYTYDADYLLAKTAKSWYLKARALTKDQNLKAKCTFMLAKCEQKKIINKKFSKINWYDGNYEARNKEFLVLNYNNPYFKELKLKYKTAPFYKIAVSECSYFKEFLKGK